MADTRLKLAVFIDFDNIEIGVKSTLGTQFDIGVVLEALKERGEVVSKIAYGDWTRAGDYSRSLTQHATKLVQRNLTPGGDKNGADINLALDALEMAFTHTHINAYVIVGGDSDFITLVEKLKQYDKQTFVVGGRAFTSVVMQRNCHEFIAYENLVGSRRSADRRHTGTPGAQAPIDQALPLVRRALKVLSDREVSPQLGLLKSTLLQLDSTFSERTYGVGSFRDFAQKLATAGHVRLREHGRNVLVELVDGDGRLRAEESAPAAEAPAVERREQARDAHDEEAAAHVAEPRAADGIREVRRIFQAAPNPPRFPMYVRQAKQFMRAVDPAFDERKFGFGSLQDLLRACQREGLFRIERDRQGVIRLFPGNIMQTVADEPEEHAERRDPVEVRAARYSNQADAQGWASRHEPSAARQDAAAEPVDEAERVDVGVIEPQEQPGPDVVDGAVVQEIDVRPVIDGEEAPMAAAEEQPKRGRGTRKRTAGQARPRKTEGAKAEGATRARKTAARPRSASSRARARKGAEE
ncbi:MAG: NYN domain-containing protein [Burkholderiales bacterium]